MTVQQALRHPWCWPHEEPLAAKARALMVSEPGPPQPGEALLVSATVEARRVALWRLKRRKLHAPPQRNELDFRPEAKRVLRTVEQIVTRGLPFVLSLDNLYRQEEWCAELIHKAGPHQDESLDGASYGLSMLLAVASLLMDMPLPADLVASATVDSKGVLGPVDGLEDKVFILVGSGLGLKRLLVEHSQVEQAQAAVKKYGGTLQVRGARSADEVFQEIFGDAYQHLLARLDTPEKLRQAADKLFHVAIEARSPILDWRAVERGAQTLLDKLDPSEPAYMKVKISLQVTRRHDHKVAPLEWLSEKVLSSLHRPLRDRLMAQVIQATNDAADERLGALLDNSRERIPSAKECYEPQLIIRGALGRALAALRRYEEARDFLRETVEAWRELGQFEEASLAICELIRVVGVLGRRDELEALLPLVEQFRGSLRLDFTSRAFLHFDLGRAHLLTGDATGALTFLDEGEVSWSAVRDHLRRRRLRWLARVLVRLGRLSEASELRTRLNAEQNLLDVLLAQLDEALERHEEPTPILVRLIETERAPLLRLIADLHTPVEKAERISREYPY
jgi:tetratricopeptide (TPR) repeat protein